MINTNKLQAFIPAAAAEEWSITQIVLAVGAIGTIGVTVSMVNNNKKETKLKFYATYGNTPEEFVIRVEKIVEQRSHKKMTADQIKQLEQQSHNLYQEIPLNNLNSTNTCTDARRNELQNEVEDRCKTLPFKCTETMGGEEYKICWRRADKCAAARNKINRECFGGGDEGHKIAAKEASRAADKCRKLYHDKPC